MLLPLIFILNLVIHLINTLGAQFITDFVWLIYCRLPTTTAVEYKKQRALRHEVIRIRRELRTISAQDQFQVWALRRRQLDKTEKELNELGAKLEAAKSAFSTRVNTARWLSTNGLRLGLQFWFSREPMFWIPKNWLPYYSEWLLAFPKARMGSVSIQVWGFACAAVISLVVDGILGCVVILKEKRSLREKDQGKRQGGRVGEKGPVSASQSTDSRQELKKEV